MSLRQSNDQSLAGTSEPESILEDCSLDDEAEITKCDAEDEDAFKEHGFGQTFAGVAGNILEWYDFALFGFFSDIIADIFFPPSSGTSSIIKSFAVFSGAFIMRPVGGLLFGWIGDVYGRKVALMLSIFLMALPTFLMGCLPTYNQVGEWAVALLILVRLLQGLSVGGQLVSSLVYTCDNHRPRYWGFFASLVMATAGCGTLLGSIAASILRSTLTQEQLESWGWRIPFLLGILVSLVAWYLRRYGHENHVPLKTKRERVAAAKELDEEHAHCQPAPETNEDLRSPVRVVFAKNNLRSLFGTAMVSMLWAGSMFLIYVWLATYMSDLVAEPVSNADTVNSVGLVLLNFAFSPLAGIFCDRYGRRPIMTIGAIGMAVSGPFIIELFNGASFGVALAAQAVLGLCLALWGAPMMSWLCETFAPASRLTCIAIGYNVAQALVGGTSPTIATWLVDSYGTRAPGYYLSALGIVGWAGVRIVAPTTRFPASAMPGYERVDLQELFFGWTKRKPKTPTSESVSETISA